MPSERAAGRGHLSEALAEKNAAALARAFFCTLCKETLQRQSFWQKDVENSYRYPLVCKTCRPHPPGQQRRAAMDAAKAARKAYLCDLCGVLRERDHFWDHDLRNRWGHTLGCKLCKPTPPEERKSQSAKARAMAKPQAPIPTGSGADAGLASAPHRLRKRRRTKGPEVLSSPVLPSQAALQAACDDVDELAAGALGGALINALALPSDTPAARLRRRLAIDAAQKAKTRSA